MKRWLFLLLAACSSGLGSIAQAADWGTDLSAAQTKAKAESKLVLINFTGSDWCGWCIRLKDEVFSKPEFDAYAKASLVLVEADFPRRKLISPAQLKANKALAEKYEIEGYPTLILLGPDGRKIGQLGYQPGGPKPFIAEINKLGGDKLRRAGGTGATTVNAREPGDLTGLELKGISGPASRRLALMNGVTLSAGEGAIIPTSDRRLKVRCLEIRERSVLIKIDDQSDPVEVFLRKGL